MTGPAPETSLPEALGEGYELIRPLGGGSHGSSFLVREAAENRAVVLKLLVPPLPEGPAREAFEAAMARRQGAPHPALEPLLGWGWLPDGRAWVAGGFVAGEVGAERTSRAPSAEEVLAWALSSAAGLDALHQAGQVHGALHPGNLMLVDSRAAVLLDAGVALRPDAPEAMVAGEAAPGVPVCMAPELWEGAAPSPASDQYAWAATLFHLLHGRAIYPAGSAVELLAMVRMGVRPGDLPEPAGIPAGLDRALARALAREPGARASGMAAVLRELEADAGGDEDPGPGDGRRRARSSIRGRTTSRIVIPKAQRQRNQARRFYLALVVVLLVATVGLVWILKQRTIAEEGRPAATEAPP